MAVQPSNNISTAELVENLDAVLNAIAELEKAGLVQDFIKNFPQHELGVEVCRLILDRPSDSNQNVLAIENAPKAPSTPSTAPAPNNSFAGSYSSAPLPAQGQSEQVSILDKNSQDAYLEAMQLAMMETLRHARQRRLAEMQYGNRVPPSRALAVQGSHSHMPYEYPGGWMSGGGWIPYTGSYATFPNYFPRAFPPFAGYPYPPPYFQPPPPQAYFVPNSQHPNVAAGLRSPLIPQPTATPPPEQNEDDKETEKSTAEEHQTDTRKVPQVSTTYLVSSPSETEDKAAKTDVSYSQEDPKTPSESTSTPDVAEWLNRLGAVTDIGQVGDLEILNASLKKYSATRLGNNNQKPLQKEPEEMPNDSKEEESNNSESQPEEPPEQEQTPDENKETNTEGDGESEPKDTDESKETPKSSITTPLSFPLTFVDAKTGQPTTGVFSGHINTDTGSADINSGNLIAFLLTQILQKMNANNNINTGSTK